MHVCFTAHRFWPAVGGTELAVLGTAAQLARMGHEATVVTSDEPGLPAVDSREGVGIRRFELQRRGKFRFPPRDYARFVVEGPWDVVHVHGQRVWSSDHLFRHVPKIRAPKVFTAHGFHQWHMFRRDPVELWYYRWHLPRALRAFDVVVALTHTEINELVTWGVPREKIVLLPDGVDLPEFERAPTRDFRERHGIRKKHMLLYAGGFYDNKRVDFLVRAVAQMKEEVELVVVGKDSSGGEMRQKAEGLAAMLHAPVRFLGALPREDLVKAFFEADLFLLGSKFEGFGIVLLETLAAGVPFVSTPAGAAPDLASRGTGRIASTPEEMAKQADELLRDPGLRQRMGAIGREIARGQTLAWAAKEHEKVYASLLAGERPAPPTLP